MCRVEDTFGFILHIPYIYKINIFLKKNLLLWTETFKLFYSYGPASWLDPGTMNRIFI